jgi:hypothetical protein
MFGGSPYQQYFPSTYGQSYPVAQSVPGNFAPQSYAQPVQFPSGWQPKVPVQQAAAPKSSSPEVARGKINEEPPVTAAPPMVAVALPAPETVGIFPTGQPGERVAPAAPAKVVDWNNTRVRLDQMGANFSVVRLENGSYRMLVALPTANPTVKHMIEVVADSENLAVTTAMDRAEQWVKQ